MDTVIDRTQYKYDIFISYSKHDKDFVKPLVRELKLYGYRIWRDRDILYKYAGDKYLPRIEEGIDESALVLYIHSNASVRSRFIKHKELPYAIKKEKQILVYRHQIQSFPKLKDLACRQVIEEPEDPELRNKDTFFYILTAIQSNFGELSPEGRYVKLETNDSVWLPEHIKARLTDRKFILPIPESRKEQLAKHDFFSSPSEDTTLSEQLVDFLSTCDLEEDIHSFLERKSCEVADYMMKCIDGHKTIFNGPTLGVSNLTAYRSPDGKETHTLEMEIYHSDYFTFKVVSAVYAELLKKDNGADLFDIRSVADVSRFAPFLSSLGMGGFLLLDRGDALRALWIKRSDQCEAGQRYHFSYDETVSVKDIDSESRTVNVYNTMRRGMWEELGVDVENLTGKGGVFEIGIILTKERIELELLSYQELKPDAYDRFFAMLEAAADSKLEVGDPYFWTMDEYKRELAGRILTPESLALIQRLEVRKF